MQQWTGVCPTHSVLNLWVFSLLWMCTSAHPAFSSLFVLLLSVSNLSALSTGFSEARPSERAALGEPRNNPLQPSRCEKEIDIADSFTRKKSEWSPIERPAHSKRQRRTRCGVGTLRSYALPYSVPGRGGVFFSSCRRPVGNSPNPLASQTASLPSAVMPRRRGGGAERCCNRSVLPSRETPIPTSWAAPDYTSCRIGLLRLCILAQTRPRSAALSWQGQLPKNRSQRVPPQLCDAAETRLRKAHWPHSPGPHRQRPSRVAARVQRARGRCARAHWPAMVPAPRSSSNQHNNPTPRRTLRPPLI